MNCFSCDKDIDWRDARCEIVWKEKENMLGPKKATLSFHVDCFKAISGDEYMTALKKSCEKSYDLDWVNCSFCFKYTSNYWNGLCRSCHSL